MIDQNRNPSSKSTRYPPFRTPSESRSLPIFHPLSWRSIPLPRKTLRLSNTQLLYLSQVVWPSAQIRDQKQSSSGAFTLQAGHYEFPFRLRLPVNNSCRPPPSSLSMQNFHISHSALTTVSHPQSHVKQTLPPSLGGIEDAYIR
jgi:hypothetical protein